MMDFDLLCGVEAPLSSSMYVWMSSRWFRTHVFAEIVMLCYKFGSLVSYDPNDPY